jgi:uncharacterized lipoprotein YmbA
MKVMLSQYKTLLAISSVVLLFACAGVSPTANLYKLNVVKVAQLSENDARHQPVNTAMNIQIMPLSIDETVDRPQIVIMNGEREVKYLEQQRWAQPLKYEIGRVVGEHLSAHFPNGMVSAYPHQLSNPDVQISLQVLAFESSYTAPVKLKVNLTVHNVRTRQNVSQTLEYTDQTLSDKSKISIDDIVEAHSQNILRLSQAILTAMNAM